MTTIYVDGRQHKDGILFTRTERDAIVKQLRAEGWTVEVGKIRVEGRDIWTYKAIK